MNILLGAILLFSLIRWFTCKENDFKNKSFKEKILIFLKENSIFYCCFLIVILLFYNEYVSEKNAIPNNIKTQNLKEVKDISKIKEINESKQPLSQLKILESKHANSFYLEPRKDQSLKSIAYSFNYSQTNTNKYVITFKPAINKSDLVTNQVFFQVLNVIYGKDIPVSQNSNDFEFVSIDIPKNQNHRICCEDVLRTKFENNYYYISNIIPSDKSKTKIAAIIAWKENID